MGWKPDASSIKEPVYKVFGLNISSELAFLDMPKKTGTADVVVRCGRTPDSLSAPKLKGVRYEVGPGEFLLRVDGVARYYVTKGDTIIIEREPGAAQEEILLFFMGSVMGAVLHQRNILPLHAGAVSVDRRAVLFAGPSSIGKSTLAAGFQKQGYPLLADDVCAVTADGNNGVKVIPGFPRLKLWADALKKLESEKTGLRQVRLDPDFKKYFVHFDHQEAQPTPLRSVFALQSTNTDQFELEELSGKERIEPILNHTYRIRFLQGLENKQVHFRQCSSVAAHARVFRVTRPQKGFRLQELMDLVRRHW